MLLLPLKRTALLLVLAFAVPVSAATRYISSSTGSDSNTATQAESKSTPWAHLPGMANCTSACASYTPVAGDQFIMMGCDVWGNSSFPTVWSWQGTSGSPIYIGVDQTWYNATNCPSGWNRPLWTSCASPTYAVGCTPGNIGGGAGNNTFFATENSLGTMYVTLDYIEERDFYYNYVETNYGGTVANGCGYDDGYLTFNHMYIHHMEFGGSAGDGNGTGSSAVGMFLGGSSGILCAGSVFENGIIDGTDGTGCTSGGTSYPCSQGFTAFTFWPSILNSVIKGVNNGDVMDGGGVIENNNIGPVYLNTYTPNSHGNCLETTGGSQTYYIINNVIHDCGTSPYPSGVEAIEYGNSGETDYIIGNIFYNIYGNPPDFMQSTGTGTKVVMWNNIVSTPSGYSLDCFEGTKHGGPSFVTVDFENNQCITDAANGDGITGLYDSLCGGVTTTCTITHNVVITPTVATAQGYSQSSTYAFVPTSSNCNGVSSSLCAIGKGNNLTSSWPGGYTTNDTGYGCSESTVSGVVESVCPARTTNTRPSSGAWDIGAYEYAGSSGPTGSQIGTGVQLSGGAAIH